MRNAKSKIVQSATAIWFKFKYCENLSKFHLQSSATNSRKIIKERIISALFPINYLPLGKWKNVNWKIMCNSKYSGG
jgi:hypothetical protein